MGRTHCLHVWTQPASSIATLQTLPPRAQIYLLLLGDDIPDVIRQAISGAAAVLSPCVQHLDSRASLEAKASRDAAGLSHAHSSPLLDASQGIALARVAGHTAAQRQALLGHLSAASAAPRGGAEVPEVPHTATCWLLHDARDAPRIIEDPVQSVRETYSPGLLSVVDLVVAVGEGDLGDAALELALATPPDDGAVAAQEEARDMLRERLVLAARMDAPIMCAALPASCSHAYLVR